MLWSQDFEKEVVAPETAYYSNAVDGDLRYLVLSTLGALRSLMENIQLRAEKLGTWPEVITCQLERRRLPGVQKAPLRVSETLEGSVQGGLTTQAVETERLGFGRINLLRLQVLECRLERSVLFFESEISLLQR